MAILDLCEKMNSFSFWMQCGAALMFGTGLYVFAATLLPSPAEVFENESLTLVLSFPYNEEYISSWESNSLTAGYIAFKKQQCIVAGTLNNSELYDVSCNNTSTSLSIKTVQLNMHGDVWGVSLSKAPPETTMLLIKVPVRHVNISSTMMQENTIISMAETDVINITCRSSYSRPGPSLSVFTSKDNIMEKQLFLPNKTSYNLNNDNSTQTTTVFFFNASREWNGWSMFCKASNRPQTEVQSQPVKLDIMYPPGNEPFIANLAKGLEYAIVENNTGMMICSVDEESNPPAKLSWNCTTQETVNVTILNETYLAIQWVALRNKISMCTCTSTHILIKPTSVSVDVNVLYPPQFIMVNLTRDKKISVNITSNFSVIENKIIILICSADGNPVANNYTWSGIASSNSSELRLTTDRNVSGFASCKASNKMKEVPANTTRIGSIMKSYFIHVLYSAMISPMQNSSVIEGRPFNKLCEVINGNSGNQAVKWITTGNIDSSNPNTLVITNVTRGNGGEHSCSVNSTMSPTYGPIEHVVDRKSFYLDVMYHPENISVSLNIGSINITNVHTSFSVIENASDQLLLKCSASGNPEPTTYWKRGRQINNSSMLAVAVKNESRGNYSCTATNIMTETNGHSEIGHTNKTYILDILYPPEIMNLEDKKVIEGEDFSISCLIKPGNPEKYTFTWVNTANVHVQDGQDLKLMNVHRQQKGNYTCELSYELRPSYGNNNTGVMRKIFNLDVQYRAAVSMFYFVDHEQSLTVILNENETVKMICEVDSNPGSTMELFMNDVLVTHTTQEKRLDYVIQNSTCSHIGTYTCFGFNLLNKGVKSMKSLQLYVTCSPRPLNFTLPVKNITSAQHVPVTFSLNVMAYPVPSFSFYRLNGSTLVPVGKGVFENQTLVSTAISQINITLEQITESHFGQYVLNISNSLGYYEQRFHLIPKELVLTSQDPSPNIAGPVAGGVVGGGVLAILIIVAIVFIIHKRRPTGTKYLDEAKSHIYQNMNIAQESKQGKRLPPLPPPEEDVSVQISTQEMVNAFKEQDDPTYLNTMELTNIIQKISVSELFTYVSSKALDEFLEEFEKFPKGMVESIPYTVARRPENAALNRYQGIYPYDHSRVVIENRPEIFINANFIDGFEKRRTYIASLGPTVKHTVGFTTFWNMVWYEKSDVIVMLTNLSEPSGMKCEKYWAENGKSREIGDFTIQSLGEEIAAEYTVRTLTVYKGDESRLLTQFHYTAWPDKKVPEDVTSLIEFRQRVKAAPTRSLGPVVVHCSAGIGRTGTYIALDRLIEEGRATNAVNLYDCVMNMRKQRVNMVQTLDQYVYLHQALVYCLVFDIEPITADEIDEYIQTTSNNVFSKLFQQLQQSVEQESAEETEARSRNGDLVDKNRRRADIPGDAHRIRVFLDKEMGELDYINAVYLNAFKRLEHFILAQSPLPNTLYDFVCMLYQEKCCCIVSLDDNLQTETNNVAYLPPENQPAIYGNFTMSSITLDSKSSYTVRKLKIGHSGRFERGERVAYHFEFTGWKHDESIPKDPYMFVEFVKEVDEYATQFLEEHSHVLVHCMTGSERSGLFCAVSNLIQKMGQERQVSIVNTIRQIRARRKMAIPNMEQLKFSYIAADAFVKSYSI